MAKVLFIQNMWIEFLGVMTLSSYIKQHGHSCDVVVGEKKEILSKIRETNPDFLGFSTMTIQHHWTLNISKYLKEIGITTPIILGGPHATFFPQIIENSAIDIICRGEGEDALLELLDYYDQKLDYSNIKNLWVKINNRICKNEIRELKNNLDILPFPDRYLYDTYRHFRDKPYEIFMASRGCPYDCNFCFNHAEREIYKGKGKYVRLRSVKGLIEEILSVKRTRNIKLVMFTDSVFNLDKRWFIEFTKEYRERVNFPYSCNLHANLVDDEIATALVESNCANVRFAIETGSERLRKEILNKPISDIKIKNAVETLKKYGIKVIIFNMFGLPTETLKEAFLTIEINQELAPYAVSNDIFLPLPGLEVTQYALEKGIIQESDIEKLGKPPYKMFVSVLHQPEIKLVCNLHKFSFLAMRLPWTIPLVKLLIIFPRNYLFNFIYGLSHSYTFKKWSNSSWLQIIKEIILNFDKFG